MDKTSTFKDKQSIADLNRQKINIYTKRSRPKPEFKEDYERQIKLLPNTKIIKFINKGINSPIFNKDNERLDYFFDIQNSPLNEEPEVKCDISTTIYQNPNPEINLDLLIAYSAWYASKSWFEPDKNGELKLIIPALKDQISIDIPRNHIFINGTNIKSIPGFEIPENPETIVPGIDPTIDIFKLNYVDNLNLYIMKLMDNMNIEIDMDTVIKIDILICQNLFNFLLRAINTIITKKCQPEIIFVGGGNKNININITQTTKNVVLDFNADIFQSDKHLNKVIVGEISYILTMDFNLNTFEFTNFTLNYDLLNDVKEETNNVTATGDIARGASRINPVPAVEENVQESSNPPNKLTNIKQSVSNFVNNNGPEVVAGTTTLALAGLGSLLVAGILGGKRKTHKYNKKTKIQRKTRKHKKTNRFKKILHNKTRKH